MLIHPLDYKRHGWMDGRTKLGNIWWSIDFFFPIVPGIKGYIKELMIFPLLIRGQGYGRYT